MGLFAGNDLVEVRAWRPTGRQTRPHADIGPDGTVTTARATAAEEIEDYLPNAVGLGSGLPITLAPGDNEIGLDPAEATPGDLAP